MFIQVGYGNMLEHSRIVAVEEKRKSLTETNRYAILCDANLVIDLTQGRVTKSAIVMDSGHHVLSAQSPEEIKWRVRY